MNQRTALCCLLNKFLITGSLVTGGFVQHHVVWPYPVHAAESADVYLGLAVVGGFPEDRGLNLGGQGAQKVTLYNSLGAGVRIGIFPEFTRRIVGVEIEYFGTNGRLLAATTGNNGRGEATAGLTVTNSMTNLIARKPDGEFRPYAGVGVGYSSAIFHGANFPGRTNQDFDSTAAFSYQLMVGVQYSLSGRTFLFSEYKRVTANFHWSDVSLDYHAHHALAGIGWIF
ncbi:MAG: outer membrane beta-barrel protein [Rhodocyclaceae bacterium]|nr:outer membrane beta-barrel protein [Rhodocyclaceae bacterium]